MKNTRDQDVATGVISLGLLANELSWYLVGGQKELPKLKVNRSVFTQWKTVLKETLDFIHNLETGEVAKKAGAVPRFLSRAQYLEQIYTAAPIESKGMEALSKYLDTVYQHLEKLEKDEHLSAEGRKNLLAFSKSIANESIREAARFHQENHTRKDLEPQVEVKAGA